MALQRKGWPIGESLGQPYFCVNLIFFVVNDQCYQA